MGTEGGGTLRSTAAAVHGPEQALLLRILCLPLGPNDSCRMLPLPVDFPDFILFYFYLCTYFREIKGGREAG